MASDASLDWLISVDDHILEPPDLWVDRVPAKDRDRAPRMVRDRFTAAEPPVLANA